MVMKMLALTLMSLTQPSGAGDEDNQVRDNKYSRRTGDVEYNRTSRAMTSRSKYQVAVSMKRASIV